MHQYPPSNMYVIHTRHTTRTQNNTDPSTGDLTSPHNPTLIQPEQLGVAYYNILGVLHGPQNMAGALHVFVKAVHTADNGHQLRGFVYYDDCQDLLLWANLKLSTPAMLTTWVPTITITSNAPGNHRAVFTVNSAISDGRPFTFEGHLPPLEQPEYSYLLHVDTWPRHVALTRALHDAHPPPDANTPSQVFTVVGQLYRLPTAVWGWWGMVWWVMGVLYVYHFFMLCFPSLHL